MISRSENMRRIRDKNTTPELKARSLIHKLGYRFRLHVAGLPGKPDLVFSSRRKVIFVHGCFWHQHQRCKVAHVPKSNLRYWRPKLRRTKARDILHKRVLRRMGWRSLVVWECQLSNMERIARKVRQFLA